MSLSDDVREWPWWQSEEWAQYCKAYDGTEAHRPLTQSSYVVDLSQDVKPSKGFGCEVRRQMQVQHIRTSSSVMPFHSAHRLSAKGETRSQTTWDLMDDWIKNYRGLCVTNGQGAWAYVFVDFPGAYYASAAGRDSHYLQFKIATGLKDAGFRWYELGEGHTPGITTFKRGLANAMVEP